MDAKPPGDLCGRAPRAGNETRRSRRSQAVLLALAALASWHAASSPAMARSGKSPPAETEVVTGGLGISVRARALAPGEAVRILVRAAAKRPVGAAGEPAGAPLTSASGNFLGGTLSFVPVGSRGEWSAWAVVGFDEKPGARSLVIDAEDGTGRSLHASREIRISAKRFPTEKLTVKEEYVEPPPEVAERIAAETKRLAALYATRTASALTGAPFGRPVPGEQLGIFGARRILNGQSRSPHPGLDLRAATGTPVKAAGPGHIALAGDLYFSGNTVIVDHGEGLFTLYAHLSRIDVHEGDAIAQGEQLGLSGATGRVTGPHLHWGAKIGDRPFDPTALLDRMLFE